MIHVIDLLKQAGVTKIAFGVTALSTAAVPAPLVPPLSSSDAPQAALPTTPASAQSVSPPILAKVKESPLDVREAPFADLDSSWLNGTNRQPASLLGAGPSPFPSTPMLTMRTNFIIPSTTRFFRLPPRRAATKFR